MLDQRPRRLAPRILLGLLAAAALTLSAQAFSPQLSAPELGLLSEDHHDLEQGHEDEELDFSQAFFHTQSRGNRGNDVKAIQYLLRHRGYSVAVDGIFGSGTESTVKSFQSANGLSADGIVGPATWGKLVVTVRQGSSGDAVRAVQMLLNEKRGSGLAVDGVFGSGTTNAVKTFQSHAGLSADGIVGSVTWKNLVWHYERPNVNLASVCGYYDASKRWGTAAAVGQLEAAAQSFYGTGNGPMAVGDLSLEHGGDISGHASHEVGLDADLRPVRTDSAQCSYGCTYTQSCYDKYGTLALCRAMRNYASGHVKVIWFNDPYVRNAGCSTYLDNHSNHLHIRYCEKVHSNSYYRC